MSKNYTDVQKLVILADACSEVVYGGECGWERVDFDKFVTDVKKRLRGKPPTQANPPTNSPEKIEKSSNQYFGDLDVTFRFPKKGGFTLEFETEGRTFSFQDPSTEELEDTLCEFLANLFTEDYSDLVEDFESKETMSFEVGDATFSLHIEEQSCRIDIDTDDGDFEGGEYKFGHPEDIEKLTHDFLGLLAMISPTKYQNLWEACPYT